VGGRLAKLSYGMHTLSSLRSVKYARQGAMGMAEVGSRKVLKIKFRSRQQ